MKTFRLLVFFALILSINACDNLDTINTAAFKQAKENREIRRISEATIMGTAFSEGRKVVDTLNYTSKNANPSSEDTIQARSRMGFLQSLVDSLQQKNKAEIKKILPDDVADEKTKAVEKEVFEAYQYSMAKGLKLEDNVQILGQYIFYAAPILENGELKGMWSIYFDKSELIKTIN